MERFLARIARSEYKNNFILKGGMLVSAFVGVEARTTMDIDTTVRMLPLTKGKAVEVINSIIKVNLDDGISYEMKKVEDIMPAKNNTNLGLAACFQTNTLFRNRHIRVYYAVCAPRLSLKTRRNTCRQPKRRYFR